MKRFIAGADRSQSTLLPECLDDWVDDDNPVRVIDVFVGGLDLAALGSMSSRRQRVAPPITRRCCSSSTSTAISTACSRVGGWSARLGAIWK
jgi:transposase